MNINKLKDYLSNLSPFHPRFNSTVWTRTNDATLIQQSGFTYTEVGSIPEENHMYVFTNESSTSSPIHIWVESRTTENVGISNAQDAIDYMLSIGMTDIAAS